VIKVNGPIVSNDDAWIYELFEMEYTSPESVAKQLEESTDLTVQINSPGGSVFAGSEIYTMLRQKGVDVEIVGLAGSAASFIAMAGKTVKISPTAQIMIHNASTVSIGDKNEMASTGEFLNNIDESIVYAYQLKTGLESTELAEMMDKETWLNAKTALQKGFVDEIMFVEVDAVANVGSMLPPQAINKIKNLVVKQSDSDIVKRLEAIENKLKEGKEEPTKNSWLF